MSPERRLVAATWAMVGVLAFLLAVYTTQLGFRVDWGSGMLPALGCLTLLAVQAVYTHVRPDRRLSDTAGALLQIVFFTLVGAPLSYALASLDRPIWDPTFHAWDVAIGFDWLAWSAAFGSHAWLWYGLAFAYLSLVPQIILAVALLGLSGHRRDLHLFVFALVLSGTAAILVAAAMPALDIVAHLGLRPDAFAHPPLATAYVSAVHVAALRDGTMGTLTLDGLEGLITFPSYHAALGVIFMRAFWNMRRLRWTAIALNTAMIAATPIHGGHYMVDVLAGMMLALAAIALGAGLASDPEARNSGAGAATSPRPRSPTSGSGWLAASGHHR